MVLFCFCIDYFEWISKQLRMENNINWDMGRKQLMWTNVKYTYCWIIDFVKHENIFFQQTIGAITIYLFPFLIQFLSRYLLIRFLVKEKTSSGLYGTDPLTELMYFFRLNTALCNSWVTAWSSVYGDTECVYPRDRISLQQQQRLSASPRLLAAPPQPRGQCDWKLHTVIILSFFLLLQSFLRVSLDPLKRQNCSHIFEVFII